MYQTNPILLDGDITVVDKKACLYICFVCNCRFLSTSTSYRNSSFIKNKLCSIFVFFLFLSYLHSHLLSFCFTDKDTTPHYISIPITVLTYLFNLLCIHFLHQYSFILFQFFPLWIHYSSFTNWNQIILSRYYWCLYSSLFHDSNRNIVNMLQSQYQKKYQKIFPFNQILLL